MYQDPSGHLAITTTIVVSCLIAFAVGAGTSAVSQGLQYGWEEISIGQVLVDGALAAASVGLAATGIPLAASIGLGAAMGFGQYAAACGFHNESMTVEGAITATVLGGIGGAISGAGAKNLKTLANIYDGMTGRAATGFKALITTAQKYGFGSKQLSLVNNLYGKAIQTAVNQGIQKAFIGSSIKIVSTTIATPLVSAFVTPGVKTVSDWIGGLVIGV